MAIRKRTFKRRGRGLKQTGGVAYPYPYSGMAASAAAGTLRSHPVTRRVGLHKRANYDTELRFRRQRLAQRWRNKRKQGVSGGDYTQFTEDRLKSGYKKRTTLSRLVKEVRNKDETVIYRFSGMNNFNDNGYFWCGKTINTSTSKTMLPMYMFDLTSCVNVVNNVVTAAQPFQNAQANSGLGTITWDTVGGQLANGTTNTGASWQYEKMPSSSSTLTTPHEKSRLKWTDVRLNLFGCKNKAIKWCVQVVKLGDEALDPRLSGDLVLATDAQLKHNAFYQGLIKPYTYNPLALTSADRITKNLKVLKTYTTIIQPTSSVENDTDPHIKVLKWFMRWDRDMNYCERANSLTTAADLTEQADFSVQQAQQSCYTNTRSKIFLLIRASAYQAQTDVLPDNTVAPSFDMCVRACHVVM